MGVHGMQEVENKEKFKLRKATEKEQGNISGHEAVLPV